MDDHVLIPLLLHLLVGSTVTVISSVIFFIVGLVGVFAGGVLVMVSGRVNATLHPANLPYSMRT